MMQSNVLYKYSVCESECSKILHEPCQRNFPLHQDYVHVYIVAAASISFGLTRVRPARVAFVHFGLTPLSTLQKNSNMKVFEGCTSNN